MNRRLRGVACVTVAAALAATLIAPAHAVPRVDHVTAAVPAVVPPSTGVPAGPPVFVPTIDPPRSMDVRLRVEGGGLVVNARTRVAITASRAASGRLADRITAVVSVRGTGGGKVSGAENVAVVGRSASADSTVRVDGSSGVVDLRIPLTAEQRNVVARLERLRGEAAATRAVSVRVLQFADVSDAWPGREALAVIERTARSSSAPLEWPGPAVRDSIGTVTLQNQTGSPLTILSGPVQCVYDNYYSSTQYTNQQSFLGSMNGAALPAGSSLTVHLSKDPQDLDGKNNDFNYEQALADYQQAVSNAFAWMQERGIQTLPKMGFPYTKDNPMHLPEKLWQSVGLFIGHTLMDVLSAKGVFSRLTAEFLLKHPIFKTAFAALSESFGTFLDFASALFEVVIAIVQALITFFTNGCGSNPGYFMLGATDMYHPWRQFAQVYNWNGGNVETAYDSTQKTNYVAFANGIITRSFPNWAEDPTVITDNEFFEIFNGTQDKLAPVWVFQEAPNRAEYPATIDVSDSSRTVTCGLDPRDEGPLTANLKAQMAAKGTQYYLPAYPTELWFSMTDDTFTQNQPSTAPYPYDYFVGSTYAAPSQGSTATVWASPDGTAWTQYNVPQGSTSVQLPAPTPYQEVPGAVPPARLVSCTVQAPEMWNVGASPLPTQRGLIMGTIVPSDVVEGPDYLLKAPTGNR